MAISTPLSLLNKHLGSDDVGIALRKTKPTSYNDFPAVRRYENVIKDLPVEHIYHFDSTGMPIGHNIGEQRRVNADWQDNDRVYKSERERLFYSQFDAPRAFVTHNHPTNSIESYHRNPVGQRYSPLSLADYKVALQDGIGIRAVNAEYNSGNQHPHGTVYEFNPGIANYEGVRPIVKSLPEGFTKNLPEFERHLQNQNYYVTDEWGDEYQVVMKDHNKPTIRAYALPSPTSIKSPTMWGDNFRIKR